MRNMVLCMSRLRHALVVAWMAAGVDRHDARVMGGLALLGVGLGLYSVMIALIVLGSLVLAFGVYGSVRG